MRSPAVRQQESNAVHTPPDHAQVRLFRPALAGMSAFSHRRSDLKRQEGSRLRHRRPDRQGPAALGLRHHGLLGLLAALALLASVLAGCGSSGGAKPPPPVGSEAPPWIGHVVRVEEGQFLFTSSAPGLPRNEAVWFTAAGELPRVGQKVAVVIQGNAIASSYPGQGGASSVQPLKEEGEPFAGASLTAAEAIRQALEQLPEPAVPVVHNVIYAAEEGSWTVRIEDDQAKDGRIQAIQIPDEQTPSELVMTGYVVRIDKGGFLLTGKGGPSGNAVSVTSRTSVELGQQVRVRFVGGINESYPAQAKAASVERIDSDDPQELALSRQEAIRMALKQTHAAVPVIIGSSYLENGASWTIVIQDGMDVEAEPENVGIRVDQATTP